MGIVWAARLADDSEIASLRDDPATTVDFLDPEEGWESAPMIDLDKEWHGLHFLLTGSPDPTDDPLSIILGEYESVGEDEGYGPPFIIPAHALKSFAQAVAELDEASLKERYNTDEMVAQKVYLSEMYHREGDEGLNFLKERLDELKDFASKAASGQLHAVAMFM